MWCTTCRQDVPGVAQVGAGYTCARCNGALGLDGAQPTASATQATTAPRSPQPVERRASTKHELWESGEDLRHVERLLAAARSSMARGATARLDQAQSTPRRASGLRLAGSKKKAKSKLSAPRKRPLRTLCTWVTLAAGLAATTCGGVLIGMSYIHQRNELWDLGLPIALGGQLCLLAGLLLHLDTLRASNRDTETRLASVDKRLNSLSRRFDRP